MIKNKENKDRVLSVRVPSDIFDRYEQFCIEEQIYMSEILRDAVNKAVEKRLQDEGKTDSPLLHQ